MFHWWCSKIYCVKLAVSSPTPVSSVKLLCNLISLCGCWKQCSISSHYHVSLNSWWVFDVWQLTAYFYIDMTYVIYIHMYFLFTLFRCDSICINGSVSQSVSHSQFLKSFQILESYQILESNQILSNHGFFEGLYL